MYMYYTPARTYLQFLGVERPRAAGDLPGQGCSRAGRGWALPAPLLSQHGPSCAQLSGDTPAGRARTGPSTSLCSAHTDSWLQVTEPPPRCVPRLLGSPECRAATELRGPGAAAALRVALQRVVLSCRERAKNLHCVGFGGAPAALVPWMGLATPRRRGLRAQGSGWGDTRTKKSGPL